MRRTKSVPIGIPAVTPWAIATGEAFKRIDVIGYQEWLREQRVRPTLNDPDWIAWIAHELGEGPPVRFHETPLDNVATVLCARCRDRDFELHTDPVTNTIHARRCVACKDRRDREIRESGKTPDQIAFEQAINDRRGTGERRRGNLLRNWED